MKTTALSVLLLLISGISYAQNAGVQRIEVTFTGGHDTDPRDHGRPDVLIAAAMGVPTDVFREAFSHVTPASGGHEPDPEQVRKNKAALMHALTPYGLTDERINEVSNYYRYSRSHGDLLWRATPATGYVTVRDGAVMGVTITNPGSGYSSSPTVSVPGMPNVKVTATLAFSTDFGKNGAVKELVISPGM